VPLNSRGDAVAIDNEYFLGALVMMHRPPDDKSTCIYHDYFSTRSRRWELRLQGKFRQPPLGQLFVGCVLKDLDYAEPLSSFTSWLWSLSLAPLERLVGAQLHFTLGDRGEGADRPGGEAAELAQIVGGLSAFDQVVVTSPGAAPPAVGGDLEGLGIRRCTSDDWAEATRNLERDMDTEQTYTFCFWGASRFIDLLGDRLVNLIPMFPSISLRSNILGPWPPHFVLYALDRDRGDGGDVSSGARDKELSSSAAPSRHPERSKRYLVDLMICTERSAEVSELFQRYVFRDGVMGTG